MDGNIFADIHLFIVYNQRNISLHVISFHNDDKLAVEEFHMWFGE